MRFHDDLVSGQKLLTIEADYMPASGYANNTAVVAYRQDLIKIIFEVNALLSFKIRYAAINYFDRFASSLEESVVLGKDCKLLALVCLITAAKVEMNDIFIYDLASGDLLDFLQDHILSAQSDLLQGLGWRLRLFTPLYFTDYVASLLYEEPVKFSLSDTIEEFLLKALRDIKFTGYRPSVLVAAILLTVQPVDNYEQKLAHSGLDMDSLRDCIEQMKTLE